MKQTMTLSQQEWRDVAERILMLGAMMQKILIFQNNDGMGEQDAKDCAADIICAVTAINYVAFNAADKCIFAGV